jgi:PAS domain S-box-containing protein
MRRRCPHNFPLPVTQQPMLSPTQHQALQAAGLSQDDLSEILLSFFEHSYDAIVITSGGVDRHRILYANRRFCEMTGYRLEELIGRKPSILRGPMTSETVIDRLKRNLAAGEPFRGATTNYRKDGTPYPVEWNIQPILDAAGEVKYFLSIQRNLSNLKQALSRLKASNDHFRRFLAELGRRAPASLEADAGLRRQQQELTREMLGNATLFTPALRSSDAVELFEETEFFDFSEGDQGVMPDSGPRPVLSAREFAATQPVRDVNFADVRCVVDDIENALGLIEGKPIESAAFRPIVRDLQELANTLFFIEEFTDISTVLGELSARLERVDGARLPEFTVSIFVALMADLSSWVENVFETMTAEDIHYLDASIISSAKQLLQFVPAE